MAMSADKQWRKHSAVDLQQVVIRVDVYRRHLNFSSGKVGAVSCIVHEACVATTENGQLYLVEKGVPKNDDVNYKIRYREGECRIVQVTRRDIQDWVLVKSVDNVRPGVTLEDLFASCGSDYNCLTDNCWNGAQRMRVCANESEQGLAWQEKAAIGVGVAVGAALLYTLLSGNKEKESKKAQKY